MSLPSPPEAPLVQYAKERENELLASTDEEVVRLCPATLTVLAASPALSQQYKMFSCTDLVGQSIVHLLHPRHVARVSEYVRQPGHGIDWSTSSCKVAGDEVCETQAGAHSLAEEMKAKGGMCPHSSSGTSDNGNGTTSTKTSSGNEEGSWSGSGPGSEMQSDVTPGTTSESATGSSERNSGDESVSDESRPSAQESGSYECDSDMGESSWRSSTSRSCNDDASGSSINGQAWIRQEKSLVSRSANSRSGRVDGSGWIGSSEGPCLI